MEIQRRIEQIADRNLLAHVRGAAAGRATIETVARFSPEPCAVVAHKQSILVAIQVRIRRTLNGDWQCMQRALRSGVSNAIPERLLSEDVIGVDKPIEIIARSCRVELRD